MAEPIWVLDAVVDAVHKRQLAEHGGAAGVRDAGLLASALARPRHLFAYAENGVSLTQLAAAYAFGIARNHPFVDGNKRTAFVVSLLFLRLNGYAVTASQEAKYETFLALADGSLSEVTLQQWLEQHCEPA
ncbi:type II toxin-antitoxin system death-on-curing family toxin [Ralstonia insidiosa]|mgnify:CR=1 FL=1|uniref:Death-on-curing protein n=1 Tax=Ralstonia insidiosa TaxID=190721 RepID=A0A192A171_9RALS|nr:type II toxin-antitoxin system death-on-curing family toxin [Ralstonia insidiosa]ANJ74036.1 death-on-curing protein [Ralstonia insidiosa]KAB0471248.1 type II toxin-antitoxin system death-on-curing family toxin [Ralstonia insidiosa]MBY4909229.1 type II toxin-antitoxin system death-on-curing family toxin [Ralstonia insidiosa]